MNPSKKEKNKPIGKMRITLEAKEYSKHKWKFSDKFQETLEKNEKWDKKNFSEEQRVTITYLLVFLKEENEKYKQKLQRDGRRKLYWEKRRTYGGKKVMLSTRTKLLGNNESKDMRLGGQPGTLEQ
jgi:hypothetical protein